MVSTRLMNAVLSMDSYNRGYDAAIKFGNENGTNSSDNDGVQIGEATISYNSTDVLGNGVDLKNRLIKYSGRDFQQGKLS